MSARTTVNTIYNNYDYVVMVIIKTKEVNNIFKDTDLAQNKFLSLACLVRARLGNI